MALNEGKETNFKELFTPWNERLIGFCVLVVAVRKAKTLNFSIAYGKTAHGLSKDWGVSQSEAQEMLDKWYAARPEVRYVHAFYIVFW